MRIYYCKKEHGEVVCEKEWIFGMSGIASKIERELKYEAKMRAKHEKKHAKTADDLEKETKEKAERELKVV